MMGAAILALAEKRGVSGMAAMILRAQQINRQFGTSLAPWELEQMPADWADGLEMMVDDLPRAQAWRAEVDEALARLRSRKVQ